MNTKYNLPSSDPDLLEKATRIAREFVQGYMGEEIVGIVFLGAIVRGYFDRHADIDIAIFKKAGAEAPVGEKFYQVEGIEVQVWLSDYESELAEAWDMAKRWTYSEAMIYYDPQGKIDALLKEKVSLKADEKRWLLMSGLTLSEWYVNRLTDLWVERGNLASAHHMFDQGLVFFFNMLFGLNDALVPDMKWRVYCAQQLERLPEAFTEGLQDVMTLQAFTLEELERRRSAFMRMWEQMRPAVEAQVGMTFEQMLQVV